MSYYSPNWSMSGLPILVIWFLLGCMAGVVTVSLLQKDWFYVVAGLPIAALFANALRLRLAQRMHHDP